MRSGEGQFAGDGHLIADMAREETVEEKNRKATTKRCALSGLGHIS